MPAGPEWAPRLAAVLHVLYLIFNEGYLAGSGDELARAEASGEAIRLTRIVRQALPDDPEVAGLLALMLLTEARRPARADAHGELISLAEALAGQHRLHAVRAHLLEMDGRRQQAIDDYEAAAERTGSVPERHYLVMRAARLRHQRLDG